MSQEGTRSPEPHGVLRRALRWWAITGVFLLGLIVGAVVVALLASSSPAPPAAAPGAAAPPTPGGSAARPAESAAGVTGQLLVNAACVQAINDAQDTVDVVDGVGEALAEFNAARLDEVVRRLQPLQRRLQENVEECEIVGQVPVESAGEGPATSESASAPPPTAPPTD